MIEEWKPIKDYETYYLISNLGRVKSLDRKTRNNHAVFIKKGRLLKNHINNKGYEYVYLKKNSTMDKKYIHRLVAQTFIPNPSNKKEVNHLDCDPLNNKINNLEWVSHKENMEYMCKMGNNRRTEEQKQKMRKAGSKYWKSVAKIDKKTNIILKIYPYMNAVKFDGFRPGDICNCCKKKRYSAGGYIWRYVDDRNS